jgi:adenosylcobinamide-phosphate synthase
MVSRSLSTPWWVAAGVVADLVLGEPPPSVPHPVAEFGRLMGGVESRVYAPRLLPGVGYAAVGAAVGVLAGRVLSRVGGPAAVGVATYVAVAGRALTEAAVAVRDPLVTGDLDAARAALPSLVGRDPSRLDEEEIARAVVESVAENTVDAVVAPALWGAVLGAPGALGYRAVNTMDAMVGYRSERYARFGTAAARLDDVANWVPARVTALLVMAASPSSAGQVWRTVRRDAAGHPSPNAGVAEAAFAAALGCRLGGTSTYGDRVEERPRLGDGRPVVAADIDRAIALSRRCTAVLVVALLVAGAVVPRRSGRAS